MNIQSVKKINDIIHGHHAGYEITSEDNIKTSVPLAEDNTDYQNILEWVAEVDENGESKGNTIEEAD